MLYSATKTVTYYFMVEADSESEAIDKVQNQKHGNGVEFIMEEVMEYTAEEAE